MILASGRSTGVCHREEGITGIVGTTRAIAVALGVCSFTPQDLPCVQRG